MLFLLLLAGVSLLAFANGANDNAKGVATLLGSRTTGYRNAMLWATATTLAGSLAAVFFAQTLLARFSGRGLVPAEIVSTLPFVLAVAFGAGCAVLLATRFGFPISTTHALIGAMCGSGLLATRFNINLPALGKNFFLPLLVSPLLALTLAALLYLLARQLRRWLGVVETTCVCVGAEEIAAPLPIAAAAGRPAAVAFTAALPTVVIAPAETCQRRYSGRVLGLSAHALLDGLHYLSAGVVSFARGLNDTPKMAALLLVHPLLPGRSGLVLIGLAIAVGGLAGARRVAVTMSERITTMNAGQGLAANLATGILVIFASRLGLPVSTTHVSVGALTGIGLVNRQASLTTLRSIVLSWVLTLPIAALLGALFYQLGSSGLASAWMGK
jgi:inorganic phosphate transporter, PiT family